jgi:hypothetical protein
MEKLDQSKRLLLDRIEYHLKQIERRTVNSEKYPVSRGGGEEVTLVALQGEI